MPGELTVPLLYRKILRAAKLFPSIKRNAIIEDIKVEFREGQARHAEHTGAKSALHCPPGQAANSASARTAPLWPLTKCAAQVVLSAVHGWFEVMILTLAMQSGIYPVLRCENCGSAVTVVSPL